MRHFLLYQSHLQALFAVAAEEERLPPVVADALLGLAFHESALAVSSQHTRFKILQK